MRNNKKIKFPVVIAVLLGIIITITNITSLVFSQYKNLALSLLVLICLPIPFILTYFAGIKKIVLPPNFQITTLLFIFTTQYLGEIIGFYDKLWWWDLLLHAVSGIYVVIIGLHLIKGIIRKEQEITERRFIILKIIFAFSFSIALGTLWEMFEYTGDYLFNTKMIKGGLKDTASDLLVKIAAAFVASIIYYFRKL